MLIEAVIGIGIALLTLVGSLSAFSYLYRAATANTAHIQAAFLAEEGLEAARIIRDNGWSTIAAQTSGATTYLYFNGTTWISTSTDYYIGAFERSVVFTNVYRDGSLNIAQAGTLDSNTKKVEVFVSWSNRGVTTTRSIATYLANVFDE